MSVLGVCYSCDQVNNGLQKYDGHWLCDECLDDWKREDRAREEETGEYD